MASAQFTADDENIINTYPIKSPFLVGALALITSGSSTREIISTYNTILSHFAGLKPAQVIKLQDSPENLAARLICLAEACFERTKSLNESSTVEFLAKMKPHFTSLVKFKSDLDIWTSIARLLVDFNSPEVPQTSNPTSTPTHREYGDTANAVLVRLRQNWNNDYLPESLHALQDEIRCNEQRIADGMHIYGRTLLLVQSTGMGKSRLADKLGETCPMINFTIGEEHFKCYPPVDGEVCSFLRKELPEETKEKICSTPKRDGVCSKTPAPTRKTSKSNRRMKLIEKDQEMTAKWLSPEESNESLFAPIEDKPSQSFKEEFMTNLAITTWNHTRATAFLQSCFEVFNEWVEQQAKQHNPITLEGLAAARHTSMAPYKHALQGANQWSLRSASRTSFCERVVSRANTIAEGLLEDQEWRHAFHNDGDFHIRLALESNKAFFNLRDGARKLTENLRRFQRFVDDPLLVVVFDEASGLLKQDDNGNFDPGLYHALNRIISCLREFPIWFFFLSTESQLRMLLPVDNSERTGNFASNPSSRLPLEGDYLLERFPPFLAFQLDVEDTRRMLHPKESQNELAMCLDGFAAPEHMAKFGRPLWHAYNTTRVIDLAKVKLVGGKGNTNRRVVYSPRNVHHVFAALSFRVSLDPCLQNPRALTLIRTAVNSFMRVIISMDHETGVMDTITPSEPIVAQAAMEFLCENGTNWSDSIETLAEKLLQKSLVEKSLKGELYARLVLTLARDCVWKVQSCRTPTFTVKQFLTALYAKGHRHHLREIPPELLRARMNFNHFVPTDEYLTPDVLPDLLHDLLRRSAGMQLAINQPTCDIMIPIYFGDSAEPFDKSECGVILIQVKNKDDATTPQGVFGEVFWNGPSDSKQNANSDKNNISDLKKAKKAESIVPILERVKGPVLFLLFDLGTEPGSRTNPVHVSSNSGEIPVWAIHSRGNDYGIFGCLKHMNCETSSKNFFTSVMPKTGISGRLCRRNKIFSELSQKYRSPHISSSPGPAQSPTKRKTGLAEGRRTDSNGEERPRRRLKPN